MANKPITIKDIAQMLKISVSTVSRALKDNPEISQKTRKEVQDLAKKLNYVPNPIAVALKTRKSNTIGVIVPKIVSTFFSNVVSAIEDVADKYGYHVLVSSSNEKMIKEMKNINVFIATRVDGVILSLSRETESFEHIQRIRDNDIPLVLFDRTTKELDVPKVVADDADAAFIAVDHLIKGGAKRVALLTGPGHLLIGRNRMRGYLNALTKHNIEINSDYICRSNLSVKGAKEATSKLLDMTNPPDAIFGINDDLAIGAIEACKERGMDIPKDISIVGFSNTKRSQYMKPSLSTMNQNPTEVGRRAAELLFEQLRDPKNHIIREEIVHAELIIRETSDRS